MRSATLNSDAADLALSGGNQSTIDIMVEAPGWSVFEDVNAFSTQVFKATLWAADLGDIACEASLLLGDDARLKKLNQSFRGFEKPTNVLSWPSLAWSAPANQATLVERLGPAPFIGDVAVSIETLQREAESFERALEHHTAHLIVHGILHLLGYDHRDEDSTAQMEAVENAALARLNLPGRDV